MNEWEKNSQKVKQQGSRDHPEQYPTENESLFDLYKSQRTVDPIPVEDLTMEKKEEKRKDETKSNSSSANKYKSGFE
ncbi:hypothetical protein [Paenibacillus eucommiae]|uniref:Uncharacterized protein n=1 Tax=Paenibacillus eucommiae TaxID=1355755 RepID=A0ABS4IPF2_9BACL|nr:hypothetical protein [Paenibacillus eucommiae]MBP1989439.1 hypothetical protein [Paenibacillus eucommiae]